MLKNKENDGMEENDSITSTTNNHFPVEIFVTSVFFWYEIRGTENSVVKTMEKTGRNKMLPSL